MTQGKNSLVYKVITDTSDANKALDELERKAVRVSRNINAATTPKAWQFGSGAGAFTPKAFSRPSGWESSPAFNRSIRESRRAQQAGQAMSSQWGSSFGGLGMSGMKGINTTGMVAPVEKLSEAVSSVAPKLGILGRASAFLGTSFGITSIKAMTLGGSFNSLITGLMKLNPVLVALTLGFGKLMERTFHYGNIIEQSRMVLTSVWNSEKRAVKAISGMREFSRITQHSPEEVVGATTMLAKYNIDPFEKGTHGLAGNKNVMNLMSGLAAMPGMGGVPIGLDRAVNAAIAGRDVRPLKALGPEVIAAYDKAREAGMSGTPEYIKVMLEELAKVPKIMQLANAQADTLATMWSTITGYAEEIFMDISGAGEETGIVTLWSQVKDILKVIRDDGERFIIFIGPFLTEFGAALGAGFKFLWESIELAWQSVSWFLVPAFKILIQLIRIVFEVFKGVLTTIIQVAKLIFAVLSLPMRMMNAFWGVTSMIESLIDKLQKVVLGLQMTFMFLRIFLDGVIRQVDIAINNILHGVRKIGAEMKMVFKDAFASLQKDAKDLLGDKLYNFLFGPPSRSQQLALNPLLPMEEKIRADNPNFTEAQVQQKLKEILEQDPNSIRARENYQNLKDKLWDFVPDSPFTKLNNWAGSRQSDRLEAGRLPQKSGNTYNTTIINNETQRVDSKKVQDFTGSSQATKFQTGVPR
jgi:hypothetical protein